MQQQQRPRPAILARNSSAPAAMATTNPGGLPYNRGVHNQHNNHNMQPPMIITQFPQHQQYQQGRIVSPNVSPTHPMREQIIVTPNTHPVHVVRNQHSPVNMNQNTMAWQHRQPHQVQQQQHPLQLQINPARSYESGDLEKTDDDSDVSTIHMGSIRPDPKYDPAKDPTSPENIDIPFVAPLEITIRVVKARRYKTLSSYHSSTTHTTHTSQSTAVTPPHSSAVEEEKHPTTSSDWLQTPELPTTQTGSGSIPQLGPINSFVSDATDSNSFSGSTDQFQSAEDMMYMEEELQGMQEVHNTEEVKQRKGMVRREFNRRIMRFKKGKKKNKNSTSNNNNINAVNTSNEFSGDDDDETSDASGNKIIIKLKIDDDANQNTNHNNKMLHASEQAQPKQHHHFKSKNLYPTSWKHHRRSDSMKMIVGQENGC